MYSGAGAARRGDQQGACASSEHSLKVWTLRAAHHLSFLKYQLAPALSTPCLLLLLWTLWYALAQYSLFCNDVGCWEGTKDSVPEAGCLVSMMSTSKTHGITPTSVIYLVAAYKLTCQWIRFTLTLVEVQFRLTI